MGCGQTGLILFLFFVCVLSVLTSTRLFCSHFQGLKVISVATVLKGADQDFKRDISRIVALDVCREGFKDK